MPMVVVIDDSSAVLSLVESQLKGAGYQVNPFPSARTALAFVSRTNVDLIVTDIYMPEEDGLEVICTCKSRFPDIPIIAMSGADGIKDMTRVARQLGATGTLRKPFTDEALLKAVSLALVKKGCRD